MITNTIVQVNVYFPLHLHVWQPFLSSSYPKTHLLGQGMKAHAILGTTPLEILIIGASIDDDIPPETDEPVEFSVVVSDEFAVDIPVVTEITETPGDPSAEDEDAADV